MQHIKRKNKKKQNGENMYIQRNTNIPQMRTKTYKLNIIYKVAVDNCSISMNK